jgi:hypothetical protein
MLHTIVLYLLVEGDLAVHLASLKHFHNCCSNNFRHATAAFWLQNAVTGMTAASSKLSAEPVLYHGLALPDSM